MGEFYADNLIGFGNGGEECVRRCVCRCEIGLVEGWGGGLCVSRQSRGGGRKSKREGKKKKGNVCRSYTKAELGVS